MPKSLFPNASAEIREKIEQDPTVKLYNTYDWSRHPLGPIPSWPESLRGAVRTMLGASTPMGMLVGPQGFLLYNNAYATFAGDRHPDVFAKPVLEGWPDSAEFSADAVMRGLRGESWTLQGAEFHLNRFGHAEPVWVDMYCSPIVNDDGLSLGTLCVIHDATERVLSEKALARNEERLSLALSSSSLVGTWDWNISDDVVTADDQFAQMFNVDPQHAGLGLSIDDYLSAVHPDDIGAVKAAIRRSNDTGQELRAEFRVVCPEGGIRWLVAVGHPRVNGDGVIYRFPGVAVDVTIQHQTAEALAESEQRFRTLSNVMPQMVWSADAQGHNDYFNQRWYEFTGLEEGSTDGDGWQQVCHPDDLHIVVLAWQHSINTGDPLQMEYRMRHHSGSYRWVLVRALPVVDATGQINRWIGTCTDIHETRLASQERELVAQELSHRIKNIFAVLNGIIGLSARSQPEAKAFSEQLRQRIYALGEAHDFVRPHSQLSAPADQNRSLASLIERLLRPYQLDGKNRIIIEGDDTAVDDAAATPLALLFHELGTNAAKYGSLSNPDGKVTIRGEQAGDNFKLVWCEAGGPTPVTEPEVLTGFGSRLVQLSVEGQMRGKLMRRWLPDGLEVEIDLPVEAINRSSRLQPMEKGASN